MKSDECYCAKKSAKDSKIYRMFFKLFCMVGHVITLIKNLKEINEKKKNYSTCRVFLGRPGNIKRNPSIYDLIRWFARPMGQTKRLMF